MIQWEYKISYSERYTVERLDEIGAEGWELVSVVFKHTSAAGNDYFTYYFKRPKQQ